MIKQKVVSTMADAATSAITGGGTVSGQGLNEAAVKKALKAAGVSEEMLNRYGISVSDIVNGKIDSSDLAKYGISANVLDGLTLSLIHIFFLENCVTSFRMHWKRLHRF